MNPDKISAGIAGASLRKTAKTAGIMFLLSLLVPLLNWTFVSSKFIAAGNVLGRKVKKASLTAFPLRIVEKELRRLPSKGWAAMIRNLYEVNPMVSMGV